jgi:hypothetical protein
MKIQIKLSLLAVFCVIILAQSFGGVAEAIVNGVPDGNTHPYVGMMIFVDAIGDYWRCSGSLLSPTVFLTAGHCTVDAEAAWITFDLNLEDGVDYWYYSEDLYLYTPYGPAGPGLPGFAAGSDVGIVVLNEEVTMSAYASLPAPNMLENLKKMTDVELVGYGAQWQDRGKGITPPTSWDGLLIRMRANAQIIPSKDVISSRYLKITSNIGNDKGSTMFGDSGGPVLIGNTVVAVTSFGTSYNRGGVSYYSRVDTPEVNSWIQGFLD